VRPFDDASSLGTCISSEGEFSYPPIIVLEGDQILLNINTRDFSFVAEHHLSNIFLLLAKYRVKVNVMRNSAISFSVCVQNQPLKIEKLLLELEADFNVDVVKDLELITIRHYNEATVSEMKKGKLVLFEENLQNTKQMVVKNSETIKRK
jgi:aspartate kinase